VAAVIAKYVVWPEVVDPRVRCCGLLCVSTARPESISKRASFKRSACDAAFDPEPEAQAPRLTFIGAGFKSCPRDRGATTCCCDWSSIEGICGGSQPTLSAALATCGVKRSAKRRSASRPSLFLLAIPVASIIPRSSELAAVGSGRLVLGGGMAKFQGQLTWQRVAKVAITRHSISLPLEDSCRRL
jgi:hypothetical protein